MCGAWRRSCHALCCWRANNQALGRRIPVAGRPKPLECSAPEEETRMAQYDDEYGNEARASGEYQKRRGSALPWVLLVLVLGIAGAAGYFGFGMYQGAAEQRTAAVKASE